MKIISKFHDYYDNVVGYSAEPVWERKTKEYSTDNRIKQDISFESASLCKDMLKDFPLPFSWESFKIWRESFILGFCGKIYPIYRVFNEYETNIPVTKRFRYVSDIEEYIKIERIRSSIYAKDFEFSDDGIKRFENYYNSKKLLDLFLDFKSPIFILEHFRNKIIVNPCLSEYNIQTIIDPYTTYQEIDMYLGNQLVGNFDPMPDFGDILKRDAHGMDDWSFKQVGPKKRKMKNK